MTVLAIQRNDDGGNAKRVHQASRHDSDDAPMPCFARDDHTLLGRVSVELADLRARFLGCAVGECLALVVLRLDVLEQAPRFFRGFRGQEAEREIGNAKAAGRVEPGRKAEGHVTRSKLGGLPDLGGLPQRDERWPRVGQTYLLQARANQTPVVPGQRRKVGNRADRDQIEPSAEVELGAHLGAQRSAQRKGKTRAAKALVGETTLGAMRVEKREGREGFFGHEVVVDHDDVDARGPGFGDPFVITRTAIAGHQEARTFGHAAVEGFVAEAVTPVESVGDQDPHLPSEGRDDFAEDHCGGGAVHVVVAEHDDPLARTDRTPDAFRG